MEVCAGVGKEDQHICVSPCHYCWKGTSQTWAWRRSTTEFQPRILPSFSVRSLDHRTLGGFGLEGTLLKIIQLQTLAMGRGTSHLTSLPYPAWPWTALGTRHPRSYKILPRPKSCISSGSRDPCFGSSFGGWNVFRSCTVTLILLHWLFLVC